MQITIHGKTYRAFEKKAPSLSDLLNAKVESKQSCQLNNSLKRGLFDSDELQLIKYQAIKELNQLEGATLDDLKWQIAQQNVFIKALQHKMISLLQLVAVDPQAAREGLGEEMVDLKSFLNS